VQLPQRLSVSDSAFHDRVLPNGEIAPVSETIIAVSKNTAAEIERPF
jgi:hypothetical protein